MTLRGFKISYYIIDKYFDHFYDGEDYNKLIHVL